jgi:hypothetical protein
MKNYAYAKILSNFKKDDPKGIEPGSYVVLHSLVDKWIVTVFKTKWWFFGTPCKSLENVKVDIRLAKIIITRISFQNMTF